MRPAQEDDVDAIVETMTAAFMTDPYALHLHPHDDTREDEMRALFRALIVGQYQPGAATISIADDGDAVAIWLPPEGDGLTERQQRDLVGVISQINPSLVERVQRTAELVEALRPGPTVTLEFLATRPDRQGRGLATGLLQQEFVRLDAERLPAFLWTAEEANVAFYTRRGFATVGEINSAEMPHIWCMVREPR